MKLSPRPLLFLLLAPVLALASYGGLQVGKRFWNRLDFVRAERWDEIFNAHKRNLAAHSWLDNRPLHVFAGDSHIEYGNWYHAFHGALAVKNIGLSTARIEHVSELLSTIRETAPAILLLHCGINDLGRGDSPTSCIARYRKLLDQAEKLRPGRILVVAVMPVRQAPFDSDSPERNIRVREFNSLLAELCKSRGITLLDLKDSITESNGGLKNEYTDDGLHLNSRGYADIVPRIFDALTPDLRPPNTNK